MTAIHTFVVDPAEEPRVAMAHALGDDTAWVGHDSLPQVAQSIDSGSVPAVVLVGPGIVHDDAIMLAESIQQEQLPVRIIQFTKVLDPDRLRDAMRSGVADVVEVGADPRETFEAVRRATHELTVQMSARTGLGLTHVHQPTPVVVVAAGKGGVGTSLVTTNLAVALAGTGVKVGLVDLDVSSGDLAIMLQQRPSLTMLDALDRIDHLDADALVGYVVEITDNLKLLPAPLEGGDIHAPTGPFMRLLAMIQDVSDIVIVDAGQSHDATSRAVFAEARHVVLVTTREVTAVRGARRVLAELDAIGMPRDAVRLLVNQADAATGLSVADLEKALSHEAAVTVPSDKGAAKSINQGDPLVNRRRSKTGQAVAGLAADLAETLGLTARTEQDPSV